ncbi:uncharacterized protein LOC115678886 [Syzygium oleosum]|uniref:uncharacterized protein LOC115678886 n=1 Tax=Syzygium oleosum TaxID=219896 RepID=UPI0024B8FD40|nr:uncharacterized protein LOC115678886 [Syzygium oleosum]
MSAEESAMAASATTAEPDPIYEYPPSPSAWCFCFPRFRARASRLAAGSSFWERVGSSGGGGRRRHDGGGEGWWARGLGHLKRLREWSEIAAGPRWKTFIRRFNRKAHRHGRLNYDPLDYALNFDEGQNGDVDEEGEEGGGFQKFSARFASLPGPIKPRPGAAPAADSGRVPEVAVSV